MIPPSLIAAMGMILGSAYPRWEANEGTFGVFAQVMGDISQVCILAACWTWVREQKYPPSPSELRAEALRWQRFLNEGPQVNLVHARFGPTPTTRYDHAFTPNYLSGMDRTGPEAEEIRRQTGKTIDEHLEAWRRDALAHRKERDRIVEAAARGDMDPSLPCFLLLPEATTALVEDPQ